MAVVAYDFGLVLLIAAAVGAVAAFVGALGASRGYENVGRGFLDVSDHAPVMQAGDEPLELTEVREMLDATDTLRQAHGRRSRAAQERIAELLEELEGR
jgi:hypothetical protein